MNLKEEIESIDLQIIELNNKRFELMKRLNEEEIPFLQKAKLWYDSPEKCHYDWLPDEKEFPIIYKMISDRDYRRGETIGLERLLGDEHFFIVVETEESARLEFGDDYPEMFKLVTSVMGEAMKGNMKSFKVDW